MIHRLTPLRHRASSLVLSVALLGATAACGGRGDSPATADPAVYGAPAVSGAAAPFACPVESGTPPQGKAEGTTPAEVGPDATDRLQIVTTVAPLTSIVANIAGDRAQVTGIIPEGQDSHTFEPKPSAAAVLATADVVFVNGLGLEEPTKDLAEANAKADRTLVELGNRTVAPEQYRYDFSFPREGGKPNPHLWTNPPMARCYATIVAQVLAGRDPGHAAVYHANARLYETRLDAFDAAMGAATATVPEARRRLLTYHDAYTYFADHYGWTVVGAIQVSSFEDPTPKEVAALVEQIRAEHLPAIFGSEVFPSPVLEQLAAETGVRYVDTLRDDDLPGVPGEPGHSFLGLLQADFVTMVDSLGGDAAGLRALDDGDVVPDRAVYPQ